MKKDELEKINKERVFRVPDVRKEKKELMDLIKTSVKK
jgi:hypothetical protein